MCASYAEPADNVHIVDIVMVNMALSVRRVSRYRLESDGIERCEESMRR